jgi:hypothetical protein
MEERTDKKLRKRGKCVYFPPLCVREEEEGSGHRQTGAPRKKEMREGNKIDGRNMEGKTGLRSSPTFTS